MTTVVLSATDPCQLTKQVNDYIAAGQWQLCGSLQADGGRLFQQLVRTDEAETPTARVFARLGEALRAAETAMEQGTNAALQRVIDDMIATLHGHVFPGEIGDEQTAACRKCWLALHVDEEAEPCELWRPYVALLRELKAEVAQ